jgi:DNA repair exonuclease SbcCD ATPase subunit
LESSSEIEQMRTQWENSKSHLEATVNSVQEALQSETESQTRSSQLLAEERTRCQQLKGILEGCQQQVMEKQSELDKIQAIQSQKNENFLAKQQQMEKEREELLRDQETLSQQYQTLSLKLSLMETQQQEQVMKYEKDMHDFQQLQKSLEQSQLDLGRRENEYESKLRMANSAKEALEKAQHEVNAKAELLAKQLQIFQKHGLHPKERAFQQMLGDLRHLFKKHRLPSPKCFISYAWEDNSTTVGRDANLYMQQWIERLTNDLQKLGMQVFFDLQNMCGNLKLTMMKNISESDQFIIICTPRWKERIEEGLTSTLKNCIEKNQLEALDRGLQLAETDQSSEFNPKNNATFEFVHIWKRSGSCSIIPVCLTGSIPNATVSCLRSLFIRKIDDIHKDESYYGMLINLFNPLGIIPDFYQIQNVGQRECFKDYKILFERFDTIIRSIDSKIKQAEDEYGAKLP